MKLEISVRGILVVLLLGVAVFLSMWSRMGTMKAKTVLDYDPFYFYRYAKDILENNLIPPKWDLLSFSPPGRPADPFLGWPYTIVLFYKISSIFSQASLMTIAKISVVIMVGLTGVAAYFLGKHLSNEWGGLTTAVFSTLTPALMGVSMAGYCDTDVIVVLYSFLTVFAYFLAMKKKTIPYIILAIVSTMWFVFNWPAGWFIPSLFLVFIPGMILFRIFEKIIQTRQFKIDFRKEFEDSKSLFTPLIIILVVTNILGIIFDLNNVLVFVKQSFGFVEARQIVNLSVAELQPISIFTKGGFLAVASRVGLGPFLLTVIGLPVLALHKVYKKIEISFSEVFLFIWTAITFYLILHGVRFSLLFSCAVATSAGYVIGNIVKILGKSRVIDSTVFGIILLMLLMFVSDAMVFANSASGMEVSSNWIQMLDWLKDNADPNAIVATWWDPGHILAGYTGLRVHADGAHCSPLACPIYPHNTRIQNMGRIMSTSDEKEAIDILKKYMVLTDEQCQEVKDKFGDIVPDEACEPASEMYFIASSDLIGKFTWMNYFGGFRAPIGSQQDFIKNPGVCCPSTPETEPGQMSCGEFADQGKGVWIWCPWIFSLTDIKQDQDGNPVYVYDYSGLKMTIIQKGEQLIPVYNNQFVINNLEFFYQGQKQTVDLSNSTVNLEKIDGLVWADPGFQTLIYFAPEIKDSVFVRLFFYDGEGLEHFELVFSNPEIRLYKVDFTGV